MSTTSFSDPKLCIVFTYAPAGLGHLRVTDALRHGLPPTAQPILLPESSESIRWIHRLTSRNPLGKRLMEWGQYGHAEDVVTRIYRFFLRRDSAYLEDELIQILKQRVVLPKKLLVIASHFGLAHQLSVVKKNIERRANVQVIIVMQVTDDSPQKIWFVPNLDMITVPSEQTKRVLTSYGRREKLAASTFVVLPYPLSPHLGEDLLPAAKKHREHQVQSRSTVPINVCIPISGAGVGTAFAHTLMKEIHAHNDRFIFHIVAKRAMYTEMFLHSLERRDYVQLSSSHSDREIVELYEQLYDRVVLSFEITKPSEQAFKALFLPRQTGGVLLLFTNPVGRQEYDNLDFLSRHGLLPTEREHEQLYEWAAQRAHLTEEDSLWMKAASKHWRGIRLPIDPKEAALFILWGHGVGLFQTMMEMTTFPKLEMETAKEIGGDGVVQFWKAVESLL